MDRFVRTTCYAPGLQLPADRGEAAAFMFSAIRNVPVPFGLGDPDKPNVAGAIFQTVQDLTRRRRPPPRPEETTGARRMTRW